MLQKRARESKGAPQQQEERHGASLDKGQHGPGCVLPLQLWRGVSVCSSGDPFPSQYGARGAASCSRPGCIVGGAAHRNASHSSRLWAGLQLLGNLVGKREAVLNAPVKEEGWAGRRCSAMTTVAVNGSGGNSTGSKLAWPATNGMLATSCHSASPLASNPHSLAARHATPATQTPPPTAQQHAAPSTAGEQTQTAAQAQQHKCHSLAQCQAAQLHARHAKHKHSSTSAAAKTQQPCPLTCPAPRPPRSCRPAARRPSRRP